MCTSIKKKIIKLLFFFVLLFFPSIKKHYSEPPRTRASFLNLKNWKTEHNLFFTSYVPGKSSK